MGRIQIDWYYIKTVKIKDLMVRDSIFIEIVWQKSLNLKKPNKMIQNKFRDMMIMIVKAILLTEEISDKWEIGQISV